MHGSWQHGMNRMQSRAILPDQHSVLGVHVLRCMLALGFPALSTSVCTVSSRVVATWPSHGAGGLLGCCCLAVKNRSRLHGLLGRCLLGFGQMVGVPLGRPTPCAVSLGDAHLCISAAGNALCSLAPFSACFSSGALSALWACFFLEHFSHHFSAGWTHVPPYCTVQHIAWHRTSQHLLFCRKDQALSGMGCGPSCLACGLMHLLGSLLGPVPHRCSV